MVATITGTVPRKRIPQKKIPSSLIYEIWDGRPIYFKNYEDVVNGIKTKEEIMGASALQSFIVSYVVSIILKQIDDDLYSVLTNESGLHLDKGNNLSGDVLIFDTETLPISSIGLHYVDVAPKIAIEVDIDADTKDLGEDGISTEKHKNCLILVAKR